MQTEEITDQAVPATGPRIYSGHWHVAMSHTDKPGIDLAYTEEFGDFMQELHRTLRGLFMLSARGLTERVEAHSYGTVAGDETGIGVAFLRTGDLTKLLDRLDPELFKHPLFRTAGAMDCLEEAMTNVILDEMERLEVTEDVTVSVFLCELGPEECAPLAEDREAGDKGTQVDEMVHAAGRDLQETLKAAGFGPVAIKIDVGVPFGEDINADRSDVATA